MTQLHTVTSRQQNMPQQVDDKTHRNRLVTKIRKYKGKTKANLDWCVLWHVAHIEARRARQIPKQIGVRAFALHAYPFLMQGRNIRLGVEGRIPAIRYCIFKV